MLNGQLDYFLAQFLRQGSSVVPGWPVQDQHELLATVAGAEVERALGGVRYRQRDAPQAIVAGLMTMQIVVDLEVIDIDQNDLDRYLFPSRLTPDALDVVVEYPPVIEPGQTVALRQLVE